MSKNPETIFRHEIWMGMRNTAVIRTTVQRYMIESWAVGGGRGAGNKKADLRSLGRALSHAWQMMNT